jgi:hypothetical protein
MTQEDLDDWVNEDAIIKGDKAKLKYLDKIAYKSQSFYIWLYEFKASDIDYKFELIPDPNKGDIIKKHLLKMEILQQLFK